MQPKISEGQDESKVKAELEVLLENGWELNGEQIQLGKTYYFKTYTKVLDLHTCIGVGSKSKNHHSKMITDFGSLTVYWTTHKPRGLSAKDTFMARYCDDQAQLIGTVGQSDAQKCGPPPSSRND
ncbi:transcriptional coactivator/pterin dehydratase [Lindgomyces ingoldianus]|uniref:Transcriptional coactivator/pterin dehydratase n=1 Tax=Lindgomyces ingoldianus TaxID=673940 RepID=A0ACB6RE80_9PLEO|nr:transcriptional coactivator/pterin dehydratase [Lindgomyces ingoldianus]KAF2476781.1 transcriptional coactivator/pterin dehydratase [Lindgomyces ingoldianus]